MVQVLEKTVTTELPATSRFLVEWGFTVHDESTKNNNNTLTSHTLHNLQKPNGNALFTNHSCTHKGNLRFPPGMSATIIKLHVFLQSQVASPSYRTHRALLKMVRLQLLMQHGWWSGGKAHTSMAACRTRFQTIPLSVVTSTKYDKCIKVSAALRLDLQQSRTASQSCRSVAIWHTGETDTPTCWTSKPQSRHQASRLNLLCERLFQHFVGF